MNSCTNRSTRVYDAPSMDGWSRCFDECVYGQVDGWLVGGWLVSLVVSEMNQGTQRDKR